VSRARGAAYCDTCHDYRTVDDATGLYLDHEVAPGRHCPESGQLPSTSRLPGWHPKHVCGLFCDGQDGSSSQCARERREGPPSVVDRLADLA